METKKLNLTEKLKDAPERCLTLYSPMFGNVTVQSVDKTFVKCYRTNDPRKKTIIFNSEGKMSHVYFGMTNSEVSDEVMLFPSRENRDWDSFSLDRYPGLPLSWDEYVKKEFGAVMKGKTADEIPYATEVKALQQLLILRDRYNRESNEKMMTYQISRNKKGEVRVTKIFETRFPLTFVNETLAEKFLATFGELIKQAGELI